MTDAELALRNLVARIDRDGGQRQAGESPKESGERAEQAVIALFAEAARVRGSMTNLLYAVECVVKGQWKKSCDGMSFRGVYVEHMKALEDAFDAALDAPPEGEKGDGR